MRWHYCRALDLYHGLYRKHRLDSWWLMYKTQLLIEGRFYLANL